ncbi:diguanylate cyclase [Magnetovibrio sp.]|uniref:diguanylate cyclase n=1 Tax=Magnetovibrio sp. TaxID=2024836 RepID=UPI002F950256
MGTAQSSSSEGRPVVVLPETILEGISGIERAISQQTDWFKKWHDRVVVNHDTSAFTVDGIGDIPLGKWYEGDESKAFRNNPGFIVLGERLGQLVEQVQGFLTASPDGEPHPVDDYTHFMNTLLDLNDLVQHLQNDAWRGLTKMDPLTGVRNRHDMMVELDIERERARRTNTLCSVAMVDLDHFKAINDTYGHVVGDMVLRHVSGMIGDQLRPYDMVYRYGGEEFLLCLPNTDLDTAVMVLERLRVKLDQTTMPYGPGGKELNITASFGVAEIDTVEHIVKTIERADMALYDVKKNGRDAVKAWKGD